MNSEQLAVSSEQTRLNHNAVRRKCNFSLRFLYGKKSGLRERFIVAFFCLISWFFPSSAIAQPELSELCPRPVLSRLQRHRVISGETIETIAQQYNLIPQTLIGVNPGLEGGQVQVGQEILIPPFNGISITVPNGASWQDLATAYGVRADVLFEINGCVETPTVVFIPGVNWEPGKSPSRDNYTGLRGYPLPAIAQVGLSYGWHVEPNTGESFFHGGMDILAEVGTPVLAADSGKVVYVGPEGNYGFLVIVDHGNGRQTRYGHLSRFETRMGRSVQVGDVLGYVGTTGRPDLLNPHLHFEVRFQSPVGWVAQDPDIHLSKTSDEDPG
ncbi:M23 family metallopeptidase [Crocosphaera sp.]|uniref:peptidoglycan DD-metalloendopeptidase family protein n=1 Tax=Crocosphaera sp. TaxID=2729996 RepID=UPI0026213E65|nr:M23 family metallopeptidase [Crocosphaera sp.]MDJ0583204.1 M23 family metallopeptidase [Crocosphaera sp.]